MRVIRLSLNEYHARSRIGPVEYGVPEDELISLIVKPEKIDEEEYVEGVGDWLRGLWYLARNIHFTFDKENVGCLSREQG